MNAQDTEDSKNSGAIVYNQEVPEDVRSRLEGGLEGLVQGYRTNTIYQRSYSVPELIQILLEAAAWKQALGAAAVIFLKEYIKKLGQLSAEASWSQGSALTSALKDKSVASLRKFAGAIAQAKQSLSARSWVNIGLPIPDDYHGTLLRLGTDDEEEIALVLALFASWVEEIEGRLQEELEESEARVLGAISLDLDEDGNFRAKWKDQDFGEHQITIQSPLNEEMEE